MSASGRGTRVDRGLRRLTAVAWRRGMTGSRPWVVVGVAATGARLLRHLARPKREVVYRTELRPGDSFSIRVVPRS